MPRKSKGDRVVVFGRVSVEQRRSLQEMSVKLGLGNGGVSELIEIFSRSELTEIGGRKILVLPVDN